MGFGSLRRGGGGGGGTGPGGRGRGLSRLDVGKGKRKREVEAEAERLESVLEEEELQEEWGLPMETVDPRAVMKRRRMG